VATARRPDHGLAGLALPTVGVEEEFFLLRPDGSAAMVAAQVLDALADRSHFHAEWVRFQVETVSGVCTDLTALRDEMAADRRAVARKAAAYGAAMVATGTAPYGIPGPDAVTDDVRYRALQRHFPQVAGEVAACGCHVHVGVPDRDLAVAALGRLRAWLPVLLALSGNSPMWHGRDSGWESYRHQAFSRWPSARMPPVCRDTVAYDRALADVVAAGDADDAEGVYWFARLSPRFPTIEIRVADTGLTVADTTLLAALCRGLVATAVAEASTGTVQVPTDETLLHTSLANAARHGLAGTLLDPGTGLGMPGHAALFRLVEHVGPALAAAGDREAVRLLLAERRRRHSGAHRQRALWDGRDPGAYVRALAATSLSA
jgi:carboxylate-amine ligase